MSGDRRGGKIEISVIEGPPSRSSGAPWSPYQGSQGCLGLEVEVEAGLEAVELELAGGEEVLDDGGDGGLPEGRLVGQLPHGGPVKSNLVLIT